MHRKFIALIIASAIAVTASGLAAVPARADDDVARFLAGLAAIALIGAAIENGRDNDTVSQRATPYMTPVEPRPLPSRVGRYELPRQCLRSYPTRKGERRMFGAGCLGNNYAFDHRLPQACKVGYRDGGRIRRGFDAHCLRKKGYRAARR